MHTANEKQEAARPVEPQMAVIFDMDGVLVDSATAHYESWRRLADECGGTVTQDQFTNTFGRQNRDIIPILFGEVPPKQVHSLADRKEKLYRDLIRARPPIVSGAVELVRRLHGAGVRLAVGSSGPRENIEMLLELMNIRSCFSAVVSDQDVTRGKPDPQVFALASQRLGVPSERCIVVEDAPVGIEAARATGAKTVAVLIHHPPEAFPHADLIVCRLADLSVQRLRSLVH